jgi:hypothetical protein
MLLGRFELLEELGSGASGTVYRARLLRPLDELAAGAEVAIKFLRQDRAHDPRAAARLAREGHLGARVRSPYVAAIHAVETIDVLGLSATYLVMELVEGRDLRAFLAQTGGAVEDLVRRIGRDAARGLAALHRLRIVHRDVKPENIALTPAGGVKLMDLGLARETEHRPGGGFSGSLAYAAPEVLRGRNATPPSDLYALGVVLFELATGRHPFAEHLHGDHILHAHLELAPPRASHFAPRISAFLETLLAELLAKEPERRPRSAAEVALAFEQGERSRYWLEHESAAPALASRRRLRDLRRFAPVPFVDRREEQRTLERALRRARGGRGSAVRVCGPHGIGRRRLLDECLDRWIDSHDDIVLLAGQPQPRPARQIGTPFPALILDWFLRGDDPSSPHVAERLAARIAAESALSAAEAQRLAAFVTGGDPGSAAALRADLVVRALAPARADRTLVLRIDRADELDATARLVVERLLETIGGERCLLLLVGGTHWASEPFAHGTLALEGLPRAEFLEYAASLFAPGDAPAALLESAWTTLAGNPGNLLESLDDLVQSGALTGQPGALRTLEPPNEIAPPGPLLERLRARLRELPAAQRHVLQAAAVLGESFALGDLGALTGSEELPLLETLSVFQGHLLRVEHDVGRFRHREYRRALLDLIPARTRERLHRLAAWVLEDRGAPPLDVGMHLSRAREHEACLEPLLAGLERLVAAGSREASRRVAARVRVHLNALPRTPLGEVRRLRWLLLDGQAHANAERYAPAQRAFTQAYRLARSLGDDAARAQALLGLAGVARATAHLLAARHMLDRACALLEGADEPRTVALAADVRALQARVLGDAGDAEGALARIEEALGLLPDEHPRRAHLLIDAARLHALRGAFAAARELLDAAEADLAARDDRVGSVRLQLWRGWLALLTGDLGAAERDLRAGRAAAHALADARREARALLWLGDVAHLRGQGDVARARHQQARARAADGRDRLTAVRGALRLRELDAALDAEVARLDVAAVTAEWCLVRADALRDAGERTGADALVDRAAAIADRATLPLPLRLRALVAAGRGAQAQELVEDLARGLGGAARRRFRERMRGLT